MPSPTELHCLKCGYTWTPRVPHPRECCNCKSRNWNGRPELTGWWLADQTKLMEERRNRENSKPTEEREKS